MLTLAVSAFAVETCPAPTTCATHTSTAELTPEWSPADSDVDYTVTFCKTSGATVNEVRIYKDYDGSIFYTGFQCDDKAGWEKLYISTYPACFYISDGSDPINVDDECQDFTFSAHTPPAGEEYCNLSWKFETRDTSSGWKNVCDTTSVDDRDPTIEKTVTGPQSGSCPPGSGEECWITQSTTIGIVVTEQGDCGTSGLDYCEVTYTVDDGSPIVEIYDDLDGETIWEYSFDFDEDSRHVLTVECKDIAGNTLTDTEVFRVDDTPPETTKVVSEPKKVVGDVEWVDTTTVITLKSGDPDPTGKSCNIGVDKIYWANTIVDDEVCRNPRELCNPTGAQMTEVDGSEVIIQKDTESCHLLQYYAVDKLGNREDTKTNCFFVDKTPPTPSKTIGEPNYGDCPKAPTVYEGWGAIQTGGVTDPKDFEATMRFGENNPTAGSYELILKDGSATIWDQTNYSWVSGEPVPFTYSYDASSGVVTLELPGETITGTYGTDKAFEYLAIIAKGAASKNGGVNLQAMTSKVMVNGKSVQNVVSGHGYMGVRIPLTDAEQSSGFVMTGMVTLSWDTPPSATGQEIPGVQLFAMKTHDRNPGECWLRDHVTPITLACTDPEPHPSGDEEVCFRVSFDVEPWLTGQYCTKAQGEMTGLNPDDWCCVDAPETIVFVEDSLHDLEYYCKDAVNKKSEIDKEWFRVDSQPPVITKTMIEGTSYLAKVGTCPPTSSSDECYVMDGGSNGVHIAVEDQGINGCIVNNVSCNYKLLWETSEANCAGRPYSEGKCLVASGQFGEEGADVYFTEDSKHTLIVNCVDALGNPMPEDVEVFYVDSTPPVTTKTYGSGGTYKIDDSGRKWIDTATLITLAATDAKVGVKDTYYKITGPQSEDFYCQSENNCSTWDASTPGDGSWTTYGDPFNGMNESCHIIEYYSDDLLGNEEDVKWQCMFVDKTPPTINKDNGNAIAGTGEPAFMNDGNPAGDFHWITQDMPITFTCTDQGRHPSGDEELCFKVSYDYPAWGYITEEYCSTSLNDEGYCCMTGTAQSPFNFYFKGDSMHNLEYYCQDAVGKSSGVHVQYYKVDTEKPTIIKTLNEPYHGDCPPEQGSICYVDSATTIDVQTEDNGEICAVGGVECRWKVLDAAGYQITDWNSEMPIMFPEECQHTLVIECEDDLGNIETDTETFYVDKTPPVTTKEYGEPYFKDGDLEWITSETSITLTVEDAGPHKSGIAETQYRVSGALADNFCNNCENWMGMLRPDMGEWITYGGPFNISEESCHVIEYRSIDNVGKTEDIKWQCVFVDNTPPTPEKTVGEPKDKWTPGEDGDPKSYFYPDETAHCWDGTPSSIDCWEVTTLTPIKMDCVDEGLHPVDHETVCFKVELDGKDKTADYCSQYGTMNDKGYCCTVDEVPTFYFEEDSEHNLKYYCVDALGNSNKEDLDEEKFKVEGTKFEIPLMKKWNLISVPFQLLNDSPEEVLKDTTGVDSVWTYDPSNDLCAEGWCVYTPDGNPDNDNLDSITPGWGYWVMELLDKEWLTLGGSLFKTGPSAPPSRQLIPGWNLIGYYGTSWELYDYTDFRFECGDAFDFPDKYLFGDKVYCSLNSLVDTQEGYPKWSSLWSYLNCGDHHDAWLGLNACADRSPQQALDRMYAGRGYWVEMDVADNYAPATTCIWNDDFECRWTGGGIIP